MLQISILRIITDFVASKLTLKNDINIKGLGNSNEIKEEIFKIYK